ncbi:putative permease PerM homolog [Gammaproteobacteria bacterium]
MPSQSPLRLIVSWYKQYFYNPHILSLAVVLVVGFVVVLLMGNMLAPVLASLVVAYLLEGMVGSCQRFQLPRLVVVWIVFSGFLLFLAGMLLWALPLMSRQLSQLLQQLPAMISQGQQSLMQLPQRYPDLISPDQIQNVISLIRSEITLWGQRVLSLSLASVTGLITLMVYLFLTPTLVFFFLKDKDLLIGWLSRLLPEHRTITNQVLADVNHQIGNYTRGKFLEILFVWSSSFLAFTLFHLNYALLLSLLVGLSVIIPFIGAAVVTVPVVLIGWFQWGTSADFVWMLATYSLIQLIDGNVLVPLMFSEAVNLHPVAIVVAILVFGGFWGFWGVFFAIPLATLVQAVLTAWPQWDETREVNPAHTDGAGEL